MHRETYITSPEEEEAAEALISLFFDVPMRSLETNEPMYVPVNGPDDTRLIFRTDNAMLRPLAICLKMLWDPWDETEPDRLLEVIAFYTNILDNLTSRLPDPLDGAMTRLAVTPPGAPAARIGVSVQQLLEQLSSHTS
jgi:hypothetical protein